MLYHVADRSGKRLFDLPVVGEPVLIGDLLRHVQPHASYRVIDRVWRVNTTVSGSTLENDPVLIVERVP